MTWLRLMSGLLLGAAGGVVLATGLTASGSAVWSCIGGLTVVLGIGLIASAVRRPACRADRFPDPKEQESPDDARRLPLSGEMLVQRYHLITQSQLQQALKRRREHQFPGKVLVEMGMISAEQLREVLSDQAAYGDPWRDFRRRKRNWYW